MMTKNAYGRYIAALLLFGLNGIVASHITLSSYEIVLTRTFIGSLFLVVVFDRHPGKIPDQHDRAPVPGHLRGGDGGKLVVSL